MADQTKTLEPGTLDRTRNNIGSIDPQEALFMQQRLGGEILKERAAPLDTSNMPKRRNRPEVVIRASGHSSSDVSSRSASFGATNSGMGTGSGAGGSSGGGGSFGGGGSKKIVHTDDDLPEISSRNLKLMDGLMMDAEYGIKPDFGFFNFIYRMSSKNKEKLQKGFGDYVIKRHVEHMQGFISTIKIFIQVSPDAYKAKIATEADLKYRFLRTVGKWNMREIKVLAIDIENASENLTVPMLIPFVKAVYRQFLTIYYIGEKQVALTIKDIYNDLCEYPNADKNKLQNLAKQAATEWLYVHDQIIKGMYPLLMRMCTPEFDYFPDFFKTRIADILKFLNMSKFDLMLPEKKKKPEPEEKKPEVKKEEKRHVMGQKDEVVSMGLKILDQLFPRAGFSRLESHPDLFPYFQPIYNFEDGFNMLSPENPLQVTIVLIRIIEDFFKGCRNIDFNIEADENLASIPDKLSDAMNDWASYHEDLFDKKYGDYLRNFVNAIYSQKEYAQSQLGKGDMNNILWRTKYYFLPHFKFSAPVLQKPLNDTKYKPLFGRTDYIRTVFTVLIRRIDESAEGKKPVLGIMNPWNRYNFDLPNPVSKRIDVLLGAKREDDVTAATNANLIKYTLCVVSVLDWWINNSSSPAYSADSSHIYRISEKDGGPEFSAPLRTDQNALFAEGVKRAIAAKKK